jgi:type I restriction enzyme, S subunit
LNDIGGRTLAEFITLSKDGEWGKGEPFEDSVQMRVIRGTDFDSVRNGDWSCVPTRYVSRKHAELKAVQDGDLVIETAGGSRDRPTGRTIFLPRGSISDQDVPVTCASFARFVRLDRDLVEPEFVFWWLQHQYATRQLLAFHTQHTGVARFQWTTCSRSIVLPPVKRSAQHKIAAILSAYDDLIRNNSRRIAILEEMAQRIYRDWFVDFRFPGHENVALVDSAFGVIPEGWKVVRLGDSVEFVYGKALKADARRRGSVSVYGSSGVVGHHDEAVSEGPGVVVGRKGNVGAIYWSDEAFFPIDTTYWVRSSLPLEYCFYALREMEFLDSHAAVPGLSRAQAYSLPLTVPDNGSIDTFAQIVGRAFKLRRRWDATNRNLTQTRDLLLPRLISGAVDVENLDVAMPDLAA